MCSAAQARTRSRASNAGLAAVEEGDPDRLARLADEAEVEPEAGPPLRMGTMPSRTRRAASSAPPGLTSLFFRSNVYTAFASPPRLRRADNAPRSRGFPARDPALRCAGRPARLGLTPPRAAGRPAPAASAPDLDTRSRRPASRRRRAVQPRAPVLRWPTPHAPVGLQTGTMWRGPRRGGPAAPLRALVPPAGSPEEDGSPAIRVAGTSLVVHEWTDPGPSYLHVHRPDGPAGRGVLLHARASAGGGAGR
jgi:hypothetical protein